MHNLGRAADMIGNVARPHKAGRQPGRQTKKQTNKQANKQTNKQTNKQSNNKQVKEKAAEKANTQTASQTKQAFRTKQKHSLRSSAAWRTTHWSCAFLLQRPERAKADRVSLERSCGAVFLAALAEKCMAHLNTAFLPEGFQSCPTYTRRGN